MRKLMFIVNPAAGKGSAKTLLEPIHKRFENTEIEYKMIISQSKGQITALTMQAIRDGFNEIVAIGGDGTLTEMIQGICQSGAQNIKAGILPCGTGNDFSKVLYNSQDPLIILESIILGNTKNADLFDCNGIKCINICAMGIDGQIVIDTEKIKKVFPGPVSYLLSTLKSLMTYKARKVEIQMDQTKIQRRTLIVAIGNGSYFGGGMKITPKAEIDDGLMDVCIVNHVPKLKLMAMFPSIFKGEHLNIKEVEYYNCSEVSVKSLEKSLLLNVDGNIVGTTPVKVTLANEKICMFCD
ncbi:diacylglycerol/lipid kinase family protein [Acidaminobacter sp.]|uniref:diacylglycerol/lipid kinase family protein n=1 Tax=Acidaminobacter sp. TaxID=1872102 RepID=UPI0025687C23|nr:diacylglycerol kinase family protein [Acidaminobacter sp.]MDK9710247.1 diacylglycerol kinase family lipid kinase [Acidaminobacter sp.]